MSITIVKRPEKYSPAGNPIVWQVGSDASNFLLFRAVLMDADSGAVINQVDLFPTPAYQDGSYINLSKLLSNVVAWEVNNDSFQLVVPIQKTVARYRLKITERLLDQSGAIVDGQVYDDQTDINFVWEAEMGRITHQNYIQSKYLVNATTVASFLTGKPNFTKVNDISLGHLYFLQNGTVPSLFARVRLYNRSKNLVGLVTEQLQDLDQFQMYRLNISPKALKDSNSVDFTDVSYYIVDLVDAAGTAKTVERVYQYEPVECWRDYMNIAWINSLGGLDSYQFTAPQDSINVNRFQIKVSPYGIDQDGVYSDMNGGIFNPTDVIISSKTTTTTRITSKELSDAEAYWLQELFQSKQAFCETTDMSLVPLLVNNTSYAIPRLKYRRGQLNIIEIDVTLAEGIIPTGASAYSASGTGISFIDSQMNTLAMNMNGYGINPVFSGRQYSNQYDQHQYG